MHIPRNLAAGISLLVLVFLVASPLPAQRGGLVLPQNLLGLVEEAQTIVVGRVISARTEKHPDFRHLNTVVVTLKVEEAWKGSPGETFTFRQYVWDIRDAADRLGYGKGQEVLLMIIKPSQYGLSSPSGLTQGRFRVLRDPQGHKLAVNSLGNRNLFTDIRTPLRQQGIDLQPRLAKLVDTHKAGALPLDDLRSLVQQMAGAQ